MSSSSFSFSSVFNPTASFTSSTFSPIEAFTSSTVSRTDSAVSTTASLTSSTVGTSGMLSLTISFSSSAFSTTASSAVSVPSGAAISSTCFSVIVLGFSRSFSKLNSICSPSSFVSYDSSSPSSRIVAIGRTVSAGRGQSQKGQNDVVRFVKRDEEERDVRVGFHSVAINFSSSSTASF